ncbi:hypothetical protein BDN72DRAFT_965974 [Pluteus cervinus]|uniref:Uncharacterized protein n=1 Tax=Pluteus cervinus TaxID=181527 RepID=A0ACD3A209_9AGAR|nr:hypothetical protein BDN72DRAFT_965974 [Pluteus cervinus]
MAQIPDRDTLKPPELSTHSIEAAALGDRVNAMSSQKTIVELEAKANTLINKLACDQKDVYEVVKSSLRLHRVLKAMLDNAKSFDGETSLKYVAEAICGCSRTEGGIDHTLENLEGLAMTWLTHFLFPFKSAHSRKTQKNKTPTLGEMRDMVGGDFKNQDRLGKQRKLVLARDGHQCLVTGRIADTHPAVMRNPGTEFYNLQCAHILQRAVADIKKPGTDIFDSSSSLCFDILRNYCGLSEDWIKNLDAFIDYPINGFMLGIALRASFDKFKWTLIPAEGDNKYQVKQLDVGAELEGRNGLVIEFKDHRRESARLRGEKPLPPAIPLPDPLFFKIHAAVGGILKTSGPHTPIYPPTIPLKLARR